MCVQAYAAGAPPVTLVAAYVSTAGAVASWQETRHGPNGPWSVSRWRSRDSSEFVAVCYFDGEYSKAPPRAADGTPSRPFDRAVIEVGSDGLPVIDVMGYRTNITPEAP